MALLKSNCLTAPCLFQIQFYTKEIAKALDELD
jgi:hypothetical protein